MNVNGSVRVSGPDHFIYSHHAAPEQPVLGANGHGENKPIKTLVLPTCTSVIVPGFSIPVPTELPQAD
jgi:hypothetical protein